ncbi:MAG: hypothetical protein Q8P13_05065 [bacterium]|nr:hypothetical protein [bacterium]
MFGPMFYRATDSAGPVYFDHMYGSSPFFFGSMMVFMLLTWILVIIALVLGIVWLWKQIQKK